MSTSIGEMRSDVPVVEHRAGASADTRQGVLHAAVYRRRALLRMIGVAGLMERTDGDPSVRIALIDGAIADDPRLAGTRVISVATERGDPSFAANDHATHVASMLIGRGPGLVGICPRAMILSVPVIDAQILDGTLPPAVVASRLASAITAAVREGASVIQLGIGLAGYASAAFAPLTESVGEAAARGISTVAPAGNRGDLAPSWLAMPGVIPVAFGTDMAELDSRSNWSPTVARSGLLAPGVDIPGMGWDGQISLRSGSSFAAAFVTGAFALLSALVPGASSADIWRALRTKDAFARAGANGPFPLDAEASLQELLLARN
jgi:subtilisin family serine protease